MKLDPGQWQRLKGIVADALEQDSAATREQYVRQHCAGNTALLNEAESLLREAEAILERQGEDAIEACVAAVSQGPAGQPDALIGAHLGAYVILSRLGRGGMGSVYLAARADGEFEKQVAIKVLRPGVASDEVLRRFSTERQILASLEHPNITRLLDSGRTADSRPYFVMEYVEGVPITEFADRQELNPAQRLQLFVKVCSAVAFAHRQKIVHRDIKPTNVLVRSDGEPKLLDFGIAKLRATDSERALETVLAQQRLTPVYASPEQIAGEAVTAASDVYSLGALLYELLTRHKPLDVSSGAEGSEPITASLPPMLKEILSRAMQWDPANRYPAVDDFAAAITNYLARGSAAPHDRPGSRHHWMTWVSTAAAAILLIVAIAVGVSRLSSRRTKPVTTDQQQSVRAIAILPFRPIGAEGDDALLGLGMADAVISRLSKLKSVSVLPTASIVQFGPKQTDATTAAKELGVDAIVSGTVQRASDRIRVTVQLVQTDGRRVLFADTFDQEFTNVFQLQDLISEKVAASLTRNLDEETARQLRKHNTGSTTAFDAYVAGLSHYAKRTKEELDKAIASFGQATAVDPHYALAYALMSDCYYLQGYYGFEPRSTVTPKAKAAADSALEADSSLAEAWFASSNLLEKTQDDSAGVVALEKALKLNPNLAVAHQRYGWSLAARGHLNDAIPEMRKAQELDPLSAINNGALGGVLQFAHQFEESRRYCERAAELVPDNPSIQQNLGEARLLTGHLDEALQCFYRVPQLDPALKDDADAMVTMAFFHAGHRDEGERALAALRPRIESDRIGKYALVQLYAAKGDKEQALSCFESALARGYQPVMIRFDPFLDPLREDPRFQALLAQALAEFFKK